MDLIQIEGFILAKRIADAGLRILADRGENVSLSNKTCLVRLATFGPLGLSYVTPFSAFPATPRNYGLEVWTSNRTKLFSYWWDPPMIRLVTPGPWIQMILQHDEYLYEKGDFNE